MTGSPAPCRETPDFQGYLENLLTLPERHRIERHVKDCQACNRSLEDYRRLFTAMDEVCVPSSADAPPAGRIDLVMKRVIERRPAPTSNHHQQPVSAIPWKNWLLPFATAFAVLLIGVGLFIGSRGRPGSTSPDDRLDNGPGTAGLPRYEYSFLPAPDKPGSIVKADGPIPAQGILEPGAAYRLPAAGTLFVTFSGANRLELSRGAQFSAVASGVTLLAGQVLCDLLPQAVGFTVTTPAGSVAVRGTRFTVGVSPRGTEVRLDRGSVELQTSRSRERLETAGTRLLTPDGAIVHPIAVQPGPAGSPGSTPPSTLNNPPPQDPGPGNLNQGF